MRFSESMIRGTCEERGMSLGALSLTAGVGLTLALALGMLLAVGMGHAVDQGQIAFESDRDGPWSLFLLDVAGGQTVRLTRGADDSRWPSWSPNGQQIAYNTGPRGFPFGEIFIRDVTSRVTRQLTNSDGNHWHPSWSPDGRRIVFMFNFQLMRVINVDGSDEHMIGTGFSPTWSPDGQSVLYYDDPGRRFDTDVYTITTDTLRMNNLTAHLANDWSPVWSPDGRWIAFISSRANRLAADLYLLDAACTRAPDVTRACSDSVRRLTYENANVSAPSWSPDSRRLAYVSELGASSVINVIDIDGQHKRPLTAGLAHDQSPVWRPLTAAG